MLKILIFGYFFLFFSLIKSDLPVHCTADSIEGTWVLTFAAKNDMIDPFSCGHNHPDKNTDHLNKNYRNSFIKNSTQLRLYLALPNIVYQDKNIVGNWTMIYDEGFEIRALDYYFFAFSKYEISNNKIPNDLDDENTEGYNVVKKK